jgi:uncharacterized SAM-binding protein YcdF (DUF218 family)
VASLRIGQRHRRIHIFSLILLLAIGLVVIPGTRRAILRTAGWVLVANDPLQTADVIVITVGSDGAEFLEAADLVHNGIAPKVAVFAEPPEPIEREFIRRGLPYENNAARAVRELKELGVDNIEQIPIEVSGSQKQGPALASWCDQYQLRSVVVVSPPDHSRRLRRLLHRSLVGHATKVIVHSTRYLQFDPNHWWKTRDGRRTEIEELEKLVLDAMRHPLS